MTAEAAVTYEVRDAVAAITLRRPNKLNAELERNGVSLQGRVRQRRRPAEPAVPLR